MRMNSSWPNFTLYSNSAAVRNEIFRIKDSTTSLSQHRGKIPSTISPHGHKLLQSNCYAVTGDRKLGRESDTK